jgi:hypothetical protein
VTAVCITGMHRTGTSLVARSLASAGLYLGEDEELMPPAPDNPEGFFEHRAFVRLDDDLLEATGGAWDHPPLTPPLSADDPRVAHLRVQGTRLTEQLDHRSPWGWKDPRACLTAGFWMDLLPDLRVVVCVRNPLEVALSLKQRNQSSYAHGLALWSAYYRALLDAVDPETRMVTHYESHLGEPESELRRLVDFVGLPAETESELSPQVKPSLRHQRVEVTMAEAGVEPDTIALYASLCEEAGRPIADQGRASAPARVHRVVLELAAAEDLLAQRQRQVRSLERERDRLIGRVAELEGQQARSESIDDALSQRLSSLEALVHDIGYRCEDLSSRTDAAMIRGLRRLVRKHTSRNDRLLVVAKDDAALLDLYGRPSSNFPAGPDGRYPGFAPAEDAGAIAHLEAQRGKGAAFLVVPDSAGWWLEHYPTFGEHLAGRYEVTAHEKGVGWLIDLRSRRPVASHWPRALTDCLDQLARLYGREPAVLDLTASGIGPRLDNRNIFCPPDTSGALPFLSESVDVVVVDRTVTDMPERLDEAKRVAMVGVVHLEGLPGSLAVSHVDITDPGTVAADVGRLTVVGPAIPGESWRTLLQEALAEDPGTDVVLVDSHESLLDAVRRSETVALIEPGVIPLPGCLNTARAALDRHHDVDAIAVKLLDRHGALLSAGSMVFADGSVADVGAGSFELSAPWHEFVRPVCGGGGLLVARSDALEKCDEGSPLPPPDDLLWWSSQLWSSGSSVQYLPDAVAVAVDERPHAEHTPDAVALWTPVLSARPRRPASLDDSSWHALLAADDVEESWR